MKILGSYFYKKEKRNVYLNKSANGFFYVTVEKSNKIVEWFIVEKVVLLFCKTHFIGFTEHISD